MSDDRLLASLRLALEASPGDVVLRLHLAELLLEAGNVDEAVQHLADVMNREPANPAAQTLMRRALGVSSQAATSIGPSFDWTAAEQEVADLVKPAFVMDSSEEPAQVADLGYWLPTESRRADCPGHTFDAAFARIRGC